MNGPHSTCSARCSTAHSYVVKLMLIASAIGRIPLPCDVIDVAGSLVSHTDVLPHRQDGGGEGAVRSGVGTVQTSGSTVLRHTRPHYRRQVTCSESTPIRSHGSSRRLSQTAGTPSALNSSSVCHGFTTSESDYG